MPVTPAAGTGDPPLWWCRVGPTPAQPLGLSGLDRLEVRQATAFVHAVDRHRYVIAHHALRQVLGAVIGVDPAAVSLGRASCPTCGGAHGRPFARGTVRPPVHFSLSHSGDVVLIGVASHPLGVDVEMLPAPVAVAALTQRLHPGEQADLAEAAAWDRPAAFARLWARKEAHLKARGTGLTRSLSADYLGPSGRWPAPPGWAVHDVALAVGYAAAVAVPASRALYRPARIEDSCSAATGSPAHGRSRPSVPQ